MKSKFVEFVRKVLIKTVLPIKKKKDEYFKKIRLSIVYRISLNYLMYLIIFGVLFLLVAGFLYMKEEKNSYDQYANQVISEFVTRYEQGTLTKDFILEEEQYLEYTKVGITFALEEKSNEKVLFSNRGRKDNVKRYFKKIILDERDYTNLLLMEEIIDFKLGDTEYTAKFEYDMSVSYQKLLGLLSKLVLVYIVFIILIMFYGKRGNDRILEPLRLMTNAAKKLTINNLHSERINVDGTKNEFKDLANVINEMLDRIETSYESQKQFVSDASHELRTPIAVIQGYSNLLNRWGTKDEAVLMESIEAIQNESKSMQDLVEKLLFLSRHDKKTLKMDKKKFNMKPIVDDMVKETKLVAQNRIILSPVAESVIVYGDKQSLKQAIRIFIDNAVKYSRDGDTITICCENKAGDCVISVADTGIGMTRNDIEHIFDRFYRSDDVRNKNIGGHGLGLSLAKLIILGHVGKIKVRSQYKKGTTFTITLPHRDFY